MDKFSIDQFFESLSKDVLKEKWSKYDKYSNNDNSVTVSDLLDVWDVCYENTFIYHKPDLISNNNIIKEESELVSDFFFCNLASYN